MKLCAVVILEWDVANPAAYDDARTIDEAAIVQQRWIDSHQQRVSDLLRFAELREVVVYAPKE